MRFRILGSSSSGNCSLLQTPGAKVLIDAGFPGRRIKELLAAHGESLDGIDAVFITHEHSDHVTGLPALSRIPGLKVFTNHATREALRPKLKRPVDWQLFESGARFRFADLEVTTFPVPHDAYDPVGYVFRTGAGDLFDPVRSVAWMTDLGHVPANIREHVRQADILVLEANHDLQMLERDAVRPWSLKQRIRGRHGHLSNEAALDFLRTTTDNAWRHVFLAHLSKDCNDVALVRSMFGSCLESRPSCPITIVDPCSGCPDCVTLGEWAKAAATVIAANVAGSAKFKVQSA